MQISYPSAKHLPQFGISWWFVHQSCFMWWLSEDGLPAPSLSLPLPFHGQHSAVLKSSPSSLSLCLMYWWRPMDSSFFFKRLRILLPLHYFGAHLASGSSFYLVPRSLYHAPSVLEQFPTFWYHRMFQAHCVNPSPGISCFFEELWVYFFFFFFQWSLALDVKIWTLEVLLATGFFCFLLVGPFSGQSWEIGAWIDTPPSHTHMQTHKRAHLYTYLF